MKLSDLPLRVILIAILIQVIICEETRWAWPWKCRDDFKCVRGDVPKDETDLTIREHEDVCKISCNAMGQFWPIPTGTANVSPAVVLIQIDKITFDLQNVPDSGDKSPTAHQLMTKMAEIFVSDMTKTCNNLGDALNTNLLHIKVDIVQDTTMLTWDTDESYILDVKTQADEKYIVATIEASTVFGARHALQTLHQTVASYSVNRKCHLVMNAAAHVEDKPVYRHRGLLIDTARHYLPLETIRRTLDGMGHTKLNVLHWHATDSQSYPLQLPRAPELARNGAYSFDEVYTAADIKDLNEYALIRGIRILLEIDAPAHVGFGWQTNPQPVTGTNTTIASEEVLCLNAQPWRGTCVQPPCGQFNPTCDKMYKTLTHIYQDLIDVFGPMEVYHMGGDEVYMPCWRYSSDIKNYMKSQGKGTSEEDLLGLWSEFQEKSMKMLDGLLGQNSNIILWSSHLTNPNTIQKYLDNDRYIIQTWVPNNSTLPEELLEKGYKVIVSTKNAWYLDHGFWGKTEYHGWKVVYDNRIPNSTDGTLGGEVAMWGEYADENVIDGKIWPRTAAFAERVWSNPATDALEAAERILVQRERLVKLGIRAAPIDNQFCSHSFAYCV